MKNLLLYFSILLFSLLIQCNPENDEDLYYEPLVEGIFNVSVDLSQQLDFTIEPNKALTVNGQFQNGIPFSIEFDASALAIYEPVEASIIPLTGILDMPSDFKFHFGFVFSPEGIMFNSPGKMTVDIPANIDISEFKGFFFEGGVPYGSEDPEIWSVKLTPVLFTSGSGTKKAVFEIPHFSGFLGVSGGDFKCGNPLAAEMCEELKEILACYISGKESLSSDDRNKVNKAMKDWMDAGLDWLEEHPEELDNLWDVDEAIRELLCWKSAALMFNSDLTPFRDQLSRIGDLFTNVLITRLAGANNECLSMDDLYARYGSFETNLYFMNLVEELRNGGFLNEDPGITPLTFCDSIATNFYMNPFLDTTMSDIRVGQFAWNINLGSGDDAVARSTSVRVYAFNLLGEAVELTYEQDFTIQNVATLFHFIDGITVTEDIQTCYLDSPTGPCCPYPCYYGGFCRFDVVLNTSGDRMTVEVARFGW